MSASDLVVRDSKFTDYYDVFYACGVYESRFFNLKNCNHICLIVFKKGDREKGWIIDPSLKLIKKCFKEPNCDRDIVNFAEVFTTNSTHRYLIEAKLGSSIREELQVKEDAFTHLVLHLDHIFRYLFMKISRCSWRPLK